jgi:hypothetical protein
MTVRVTVAQEIAATITAKPAAAATSLRRPALPLLESSCPAGGLFNGVRMGLPGFRTAREVVRDVHFA